MKLYIIRHGQTAWNKEEVFRGTRDIPLNEVGLKEAVAVGAYLESVPFDALYTSPLSRARQTAQAVAEATGLAPLDEPNLIDLNFGDWQGISLQEVKEKYPELYATWTTRPERAAFPGGESLNDVLTRVKSLLSRLLKEYPEDTVALFTHRVVCKVFICHLLGLGLEHFWQIEQSTACLNRFRFSMARRQWICEVLNSQCHLESLAGQRTTADF